MRRFFVKGVTEKDLTAEIKGGELKHLRDVLRLKAGDDVALLNGEGREFSATVEEVGKTAARVRINAVASVKPRQAGVTLLISLTKGEKPELVVEKATELGAAGLVFFHSERSVVRLDAAKAEARLRRLEKVSISAAKQSGFTLVPSISMEKNLQDALIIAPPEAVKIALYEEEKATGLKDALRGAASKKDGVYILIGPEGGFSRNEAEEIKKAAFIAATIGSRVVRAETAAIAALAATQYELGEMDPEKEK